MSELRDLLADLRQWSTTPPDLLARTEAELAQAEAADADCEIHADNADSVGAFIACETQWRVAGVGMGAVWLGLDYAAVAAWLRVKRFGLSRAAALMDDLIIMERAALPVLNAPRDRTQAQSQAQPPAAPADPPRH